MKVKVVNNNPKHGGIEYGSARNLTLGQVYEVLAENTELYTILNDIGKEEGYVKERFEIVPEKIKVKCINKDTVVKELEIGKVYEIEFEKDLMYFIVVNPKIHYPVGYYKSHFEVVKDDVKKVKCISNDLTNELEVGKTYEVVYDDGTMYCVQTKYGVHTAVKSHFELVKGEEQMKVTLPNGMVVEGSPEQVKQVASFYGIKNLVGDDQYYYSESKGELLLIYNMNTSHLRNAILKFYREWTEKLSEIKNPQLLCRTMQSGIQDRAWLSMVRTYSTRKEE